MPRKKSSETGIPATQTIYETVIKKDRKYYIAAGTDRSKYFCYEDKGGTVVKLGQATTPPILHEKYIK